MFIPIEETHISQDIPIHMQQGPRGLTGFMIWPGFQLWSGLLTSLALMLDPELTGFAALLVVAFCFVLHRYHTHRKSFRKWFPTLMGVLVALNMFGSDTGAYALGALLGGISCPLYVIFSRRSRNTFVEGD